MKSAALRRSWIPVAVALLAVAPALAAPTCTTLPRTLCGNRVVPEPRGSVTYLSFAEFGEALQTLATEFPGKVKVDSMGTSAAGHAIPAVEVTDPSSPVPYAQRRLVYISQSIHGNEQAGREGMIRVVEDLARATDPETVSLLQQLRVVQFVPNPDGWARGDPAAAGPAYTRGNAGGVDLNRQFPWRGWIPETRTPMSEPEARAVASDVRARVRHGEVASASADIHGMTQDQAAVWTMLSAGEFDLTGVARQVVLGEAIEREVQQALGPHALFILGEAAGHAVVPHILTSSSEFQGGLSGSGFLGDWLAQKEGLNAPSVSTIEMFYNQQVNAATYPAEIVQIHVDSVRAIVRALMEQAVSDTVARVVVPGEIGYLHDPARVAGATPMRFFEDLEPLLSRGLRRLEAADRLDGLGALVVPGDRIMKTASIPSAAAAIRSFATGGGSVVLTDAGLRLLPLLVPGIARADVVRAETVIGDAAFQDRAHPLAAGVRANALHTYEPAPLGYNSETAQQAPVWSVARAAWEGAGGATVATTGPGVSIGDLRVGKGAIRIIGGLLPPSTTKNRHPYGLASYAPVDTGYRVFLNAIGGRLEVRAAQVRGARQRKPAPKAPLPATGLGVPNGPFTAAYLVGALGVARALGRRRFS